MTCALSLFGWCAEFYNVGYTAKIQSTRGLNPSPVGSPWAKAFELAERVGVSKQSISKIMTGLKRPRQTTFTKICEVLVSTPEEERALVQAYLNSKALKKDTDPPLNPAMEANAHIQGFARDQ